MKKIAIDGVIGWDVWPSMIRKELDSASGDDVEIEISSPGGSVFDGIEIFNLIRDYSRSYNVTTKITGLAASMASYIALAGNKVIAEDNAIYMIHNVWTGAVGDYREMRKTADVIENLTNMLAKTYKKKTGKALNEIRELMDNETWLYGEEMVKAGFVDEIIKTESDEDKNAQMNYAQGRVKNCFAMMEQSEKAKKDLSKVAALVSDYEIKNHKSEPEEKQVQENNIERKNSMDELEKMKAEIEKLKAENKALKDENENIQAHLEYADIAPNEVLNAIINKEEFSAKIHNAKYGKIQLKAELQKGRIEDNAEDLNTGVTPENGDDAADTSSYIAKLKARRGIK